MRKASPCSQLERIVIGGGSSLHYTRQTVTERLTGTMGARCKTRLEITRSTSAPSRRATIRSRREWTGNTCTASATSIGRPRARKSLSTSTASYTYQSPRLRLIRWKQRVGSKLVTRGRQWLMVGSQYVNYRNFYRRSRTSNHTLSSGNGRIGILLKARMDG